MKITVCLALQREAGSAKRVRRQGDFFPAYHKEFDFYFTVLLYYRFG